jgi:phage I-like protein
MASNLSIAALSQPAQPKREFRVIPAGRFSAVDGRPKCGSWNLSPAGAAKIVAAAKAKAIDYVIDYEHASMIPGKVAPAAGWFKQLEARTDGIYVTDARWNDAALRMIDSKEYRFISPVIIYDDTSGDVEGLHNVSLVNHPALPTLTDLAALKADAFAAMGVAALSEEAKHIAHLFGLTPEDFVRNSAALAGLSVAAHAAQTAQDAPAGRLAYLLGQTPEDLAKFGSTAETTRPGFEGTGMTDLRAAAFVSMYSKTPAELRAEFPNLKF